ncbi:hypothetical protein Tco_0911566 [Tanacetum coccineum]|uniref:Uncharacterized protein n=1 Tax=Tanacetum coccineum TaxID=301880 RepID=A0ABQ5CZD5_9ASTR
MSLSMTLAYLSVSSPTTGMRATSLSYIYNILPCVRFNNQVEFNPLSWLFEKESKEYMMKNVFWFKRTSNLKRRRQTRILGKGARQEKEKEKGKGISDCAEWVVKKRNVTLLAKVRCFLIQSGLSKIFWAEDTTMSTYLVTRSPSSAIGFKTPIDIVGFLLACSVIKQGCLGPVVLYRNRGSMKVGGLRKLSLSIGVVGLNAGVVS